MKYTQMTKLADQHFKGTCPICAEQTEFREHFTFWLIVRALAVLVAKPWNVIHTTAASNATAENLSCDRCKTYVEVCPLCLAGWRGTMSSDGVKCPGCDSQLF